jgi:hypothetical protein
VFDPLALVLLLAATKTLEWERGVNIIGFSRKPEYEPDDGPLTDEQLDQWADEILDVFLANNNHAKEK